MAHELTARNDGTFEMAYMASNGEPWHGLGQAMPDAQGADIDAWETAAGFDWKIKRAKVRYPVNCDDATNPDAWRAMDDRHVLLRSDNGNPLGIVSDDYKLVQPHDVLHFFADLIGAAGFTLDTAGTLFGGKRFWAMASIGETASIADPADKLKGKLLVCTSCDGSMATEARYTTVRVVCNNTLGFSRSHGAPNVKIYHSARFNKNDVQRQLGITQARDAFANAMDHFRALAASPIDGVDTVKLTGELFAPGFAEMKKAEQDKIMRTKPMQAVGNGFLNETNAGANMRGVSGTGWGWLNAVTDYVDHAARSRSTGNRINSAWFGRGEALKQRALELVTEYVGAGTSGTVRGGIAPATYRSGIAAEDYAAGDAGAHDGLLDAVLANTPDNC